MFKKLSYVFLIVIVVAGFWFRLKGISTNHSFWADEAYISSVSRDLAQGKMNFIQAIKTPGVSYQPLSMLLTAVGFKLFGISEWAARIPVVFFGALGIIFAYLVTKKLSDENGGLLAAFLYAFSQLNLANSTQAKPYTILETLFLVSIYLLIRISESKKKNLSLHIINIIVLSAATLFHLIGVFFWIPYFVYIFPKIKNKFIIFIGVIIATFVFNLWPSVIDFFKPFQGKYIFIFNNTTYLRELLWRNYAFIFLPATFGILISWKKNKSLISGIIIWSLTLLFFWNFRSYSHNIRYLVSFFGIIFVFFAVFWAKVGEKLLSNKSWLSCLLVAGMIYLGGYKIIRKPADYYTPNADLYGDVQIADYKTMYKQIEKKFPDLSERAIFNDLIDTERWYLKQQATAYFMKGFGNDKPEKHPADGKTIYKTLNQFLLEKSKHEKGLLIVEDWESFLPEDIKQYAKKNMKRVIRIEGLPQAAGDNWPLEVYEWH